MLPTEIVPALRPAPEVRSLLDAYQVRRYRAIPLRRDSNVLVVAMTDPTDLESIKEIEFLAGVRLRPVVASESVIQRAIDQHYGAGPPLPLSSAEAERVAPADSPVVELQRVLCREARRLGASDVHIDPTKRSSRIRYRVDGSMVSGFEIPRWLHERLVARIKVVAGLDISERRLPQDGHLTDTGAGLEARVSTLPGYAGEAVVMRLFRDHLGLPNLDQIGCPPAVRARLIAMTYRSQGVLLVTGPTGSGKTTTLYGIINELRGRGLNIVTIEDPVEYRAEGLRQVQVDDRRELTFQVALRSTLRQDPDVILVGEIRDGETARIAFHAGLTGHLVLSTVHATEAIAALVRLSELGVDRGVARSTLVGVIAQRLLRRNCPHCLVPDSPPDDLPERMGIAPAVRSRLRRAQGCHRCRFSGTQGRVPLFEILEVGAEVGACLMEGRETDLRQTATTCGFVSLLAQAREHVLAGDISVEEAYRSCYFGESV